MLTGVTGLPAVGRRSGLAASVGAALVAAPPPSVQAWTLDDLDPVGDAHVPTRPWSSATASWPAADADAARRLIALEVAADRSDRVSPT